MIKSHAFLPQKSSYSFGLFALIRYRHSVRCFFKTVDCGQGMQVMHSMTNELLRDDRFFFFFFVHDFGTKIEKSKADSKRIFFLQKNTMTLGQKLVSILESQTIFLSYP